MDLASVVFVGGSHVGAIIDAARDAEVTIGGAINLRRLPELAEQLERGALPAELLRKIRGRTVISLVGGNAHNRIGLIRHPRPFDFVLPLDPNISADEGELIPAEALEAALRTRMRYEFASLTLLRQHAEGSVYHLQSPPPIGDDEYIRRNMDAYFEKRANVALQVVSPRLRYKLWRLHSEVVRQECLELDVRFIPCPPASVVEGFLRPDLYGNATHANEAYGAMCLAQVAEL